MNSPAMAPNSAVPQQPLKFDASPASLLAAAEERTQRAIRAVDKVLAEVSPSTATFANSILPLIEAENERIHNDPPISFYSHASPSEALRTAAGQAEKQVLDALADLFSRQELYDLAVGVMQSPDEMSRLDAESEVYLRRLWYSLVELGFGIPDGARRDRYKEIRKRIRALKMEIRKNFRAENEGVWLTRDSLDGVSENVLSQLQKGESGDFWLKLDSAAFLSIRREASKASTRKEIFIKDASRCSENASLVRELFILRDEAARLLGYKNHATFRLEPNLVSTPEEVTVFLQEFQHDITPHLQRFMHELVDVKQEYLQKHPKEDWDDPQKIFLWDMFFYQNLLQEERRRYDKDKMKEYFTLEYTVPEMLDMLGSHFQVRFEKVDTSDDASLTWQEDVIMYRVWHADQAGGAFMGYFYYDLYERPGKIPQCIAYSVQKGYRLRDGTRRYPTSAVLLSVSKPNKGKPCLLNHFDVLALLHETGHALHNLVSETQYGLLHGTGVTRDFVEVHAMVVEKFMTIPRLLRKISCHYSHLGPEYAQAWRREAGDTSGLPDRELPEQLVAASLQLSKEFNLSRSFAGLASCLFDMAVHNPESNEILGKMNLAETYNRIHRNVRLLHGPEDLGGTLDWGYGFVHLRHLSGEYDAQYYTYLSSRVYGFAIFDTILKDGESFEEQCMRFRDQIMKPGGSKPGKQLLADFFGEEMSLREIVQKFGVENI